MPFDFSAVNGNILSVIVLCSLDSISSGFFSKLSKEFDMLLFTNEYILNSILGIGLVYMGSILNADLFIPVAIILTARIFYNSSKVCRLIFQIN